MGDWLIYAALGRLIIFVIQSFPMPKKIKEHPFFGKLYACDFCLGVWVFSFMAFFVKIDLLTEFGFFYVPFVSEVVTGMFTSLFVHLVRLGWHTKFDVVVI